MYYFGMAVFVLLLALLSVMTGAPLSFVDVPSLVVILGITLPILLASGLQKDFLRGLRLMQLKENPFTAIELRQSVVALKLVNKGLLLGGVLGTLFGLVVVLSQSVPSDKLGPSLAVALLTLVYSIVLSGLLIPVQARVEAVLETLNP